ncbi:MAG: bifunctional alpha,alpha-trehalose-phosphate synthase (UDP-forming)/trehalose-phosphatase [Bdellovibrionales bacterium]|nr:bifunctional alpha,alpha-trehalose-phosphate synthase (UDP-forming)/trehalose-phosphatase [Bdellovibrionales bacterium]
MKDEDLYVVSNRLPVQVEKKVDHWDVRATTGGLASALEGIKSEIKFSWFGWPGVSVEKGDEEKISSLLNPLDHIPVFLEEHQIKQFYDGFCNSVLWPLFHYLPGRVDFDLPYWDEFKKVNEQFAQQLISQCHQNAKVWIHDYHLFLLPKLLKDARPDLRIGFFLHIPFPSSEIYRLLPVRKDILEGILGSDLIGFHTVDYARHFASSCLRVLGVELTPTEIHYNGRTIFYGSYPIGINIRQFRDILKDPVLDTFRLSIRERYKDLRVLLGVDRIDYTKGLPLKLKAFEIFLDKYPEWQKKVILIQVAVPSRMKVKEYRQIKAEVDELVGRINGRFGDAEYSPIQYIAHDVSFEEMCALYEQADAMLVTSIRDGMNLVSLEYVACQKDRHGVLIMSEFAGAAQSLGGAIVINPWDAKQTAEAMHHALTMNETEKGARALQNYTYVNDFPSIGWANRFIRDLGSEDWKTIKAPTDLMVDFLALKKEFESKKHRLLLLDYDGTLVPFYKEPEDAKPTVRLLKIMESISERSQNQIYIISGRSEIDLDQWFGHLNIGLAAEHGLMTKYYGSREWTQRQSVSLDWMPMVEKILIQHAKHVPGSFVEKKKSALVWHYRQTEEQFGKWQALELSLHLEQILANLPVSVVGGNKIVEIRPHGVDKGSWVRELFERNAMESSFVLCAGDDRTDEDMFEVLPSGAWSCKIGQYADTKANYYLKSSLELVDLLEEISRWQ